MNCFPTFVFTPVVAFVIEFKWECCKKHCLQQAKTNTSKHFPKVITFFSSSCLIVHAILQWVHRYHSHWIARWQLLVVHQCQRRAQPLVLRFPVHGFHPEDHCWARRSTRALSRMWSLPPVARPVQQSRLYWKKVSPTNETWFFKRCGNVC